MQTDFRLVAVASVLMSLALAASGAEMNTAAGKQLAKEWCAACHVVEPGQTETTSTAAPTFLDVAANPGTTEMSLRAFSPRPMSRCRISSSPTSRPTTSLPTS
jgi:cytochrome c2